MSIQIYNLRNRVMGCWLGKAVGGTLGQSFEGLEGPLLEVDFYDPVPDTMVPNDDLDLQVVWACVMDQEADVRVDRHLLARAWRENVEFPFNEYGVAKRNLDNGLHPPVTGSFDNWYVAGEGAAIRAELWACLAPGQPELAAAYAYEDACVDHAGEGIWAAVFIASLESAAFVHSDPDTLLDIASSSLPEDSRVRRAVADTRNWVREGKGWLEVREYILRDYDSQDFTDVSMNTAFFILGWLVGRDFDEAILICNNCGKDTDSSTASLGSLLGILDPDSIPSKWLSPIGRDLVLSPEIVGIEPPKTLDGFTDLVLDLRKRLDGRAPDPDEVPSDTISIAIPVEMEFTRFWPKPAIRHRFLPAPSEAPARSGRELATTHPGTWHSVPARDFADDALLLRYTVRLQAAQSVRIMFNTTEDCRVWLDGNYLFGRETGGLYEPARLFPTPHMPPLNQYADVTLGIDEHEILVAIRKPQVERAAEWVIGIADAETDLWLTNVFTTGGASSSRS